MLSLYLLLTVVLSLMEMHRSDEIASRRGAVIYRTYDGNHSLHFKKSNEIYLQWTCRYAHQHGYQLYSFEYLSEIIAIGGSTKDDFQAKWNTSFDRINSLPHFWRIPAAIQLLQRPHKDIKYLVYADVDVAINYNRQHVLGIDELVRHIENALNYSCDVIFQDRTIEFNSGFFIVKYSRAGERSIYFL